MRKFTFIKQSKHFFPSKINSLTIFLGVVCEERRAGNKNQYCLGSGHTSQYMRLRKFYKIIEFFVSYK